MTDARIDEIIYHPHYLERKGISFDTTVGTKDFFAVEGNVADNLSVERNKVGNFIPQCRCISDRSSLHHVQTMKNRVTQANKEQPPLLSPPQIPGSEV